MGAIPGWLPILAERINWGCSTSPWFVDLADESKIIKRGRRVMLDLWPYIKDLPVNISAVRQAVPESMTAATKLLSRLADDERTYQRLFTQQFVLAERLTMEEAESEPTHERTQKLCQTMAEMCQRRDFVDGCHAIVAAELVATIYGRTSIPHYERYFEKHSDEYTQQEIDDGLEWLRLHAKTHTRHAIWMTKMLRDIGSDFGNEIPEGALAILNCFLRVWECPAEPNVSQFVKTLQH